LNVAAVGLTLAAGTSAVFGALLHGSSEVAFATAVPTWILGTVWAWLLRRPRTVGRSPIRLGWVLSIPLAMLNSALAAGWLFGSARDGLGFLVGAFAGATFGAIFWIPALVATLLCFGVPIAWAQRLAAKGLAGEERGEWIVGLACAVIGLGSVALAVAVHWSVLVEPWRSSTPALWVTAVLGAVGAMAGGTAAALAIAREMRRRTFVAGVEAGTIHGYRIDPTDEGMVLVRVVSQGGGYRVADFEEDVFELDAFGNAMRAK
jgi:hypothetical protein